MPEKFDAAVVGAGPAGSTAALVLAREGLKVALLERGEEPGQKNVFGGVLHYSEALNHLLPNFWEKAPLERRVTTYKTTLLTGESALSFTYKDHSFGNPPFNGFTLLRAKFDRWYARKAEEAGALLIPGTTAEELIREGNQVVGVKTGRREGEIYADTVILADGANSLLARKAGLREDFSPSGFSVAAKEILALPDRVIEERFDLEGGEGMAHIFVGSCTRGIEGGGFLYTNRSSLSLGVVCKLNALQQKQVSIADLLEEFKNGPHIRRAIRDAVLKEYSGHLIPERGIKGIPELCGNGILVVGDAAGFVLSTGSTLQGMNFAIESGRLAAEAFKLAKGTGDFSKKGLSSYKGFLERSFVMKDLRTFSFAPQFLSNPRVFERYPSLACAVARSVYRVDGQPRQKALKALRAEVKGKISLWHLVRDLVQMSRTLLW